MFNDTNLGLATELLEAIKFFNAKGWSPATSTNYSVRSVDPAKFIISRSGVDKSKFSLDDLILIDGKGSVQSPFNRSGVKSSAETEIHTTLYEKYPQINCVLHTHSVLGTVLSNQLAREKQIRFAGYEILKGLEGNQTHDLEEFLPIVPNSQSMPDIIRDMKDYLKTDLSIHGFLIAGHGLYTWGKDISTAKRHVETFEFLFECLQTTRRI